MIWFIHPVSSCFPWLLFCSSLHFELRVGFVCIFFCKPKDVNAGLFDLRDKLDHSPRRLVLKCKHSHWSLSQFMCRTLCLYVKSRGEPSRVLLLQHCHNHLADIPLRSFCVLKWKASWAWEALELLPGRMILFQVLCLGFSHGLWGWLFSWIASLMKSVILEGLLPRGDEVHAHVLPQL